MQLFFEIFFMLLKMNNIKIKIFLTFFLAMPFKLT